MASSLYRNVIPEVFLLIVLIFHLMSYFHGSGLNWFLVLLFFFVCLFFFSTLIV